MQRMAILGSRRFLPVFLTQFMGAFNDNLFKNALVILITYRLAALEGVNGQLMVTAAAVIFMTPYLLFSSISGQLADKYNRATLARIIKTAEIIIVILAAIGFFMQATYFLLGILFLLGVQSTFFGPIKYALLPQHLEDNELVTANAYINAGSFIAILIGTLCGGLIILLDNGNTIITIAMLAIAAAGYTASRYIPSAQGADPELSIDWNVMRRSWMMIQKEYKNTRVYTSIMLVSWFWLIGATYLSQFPTLAKDILYADETVVTFFLTLFSVGIAIGAFLCSAIVRGAVSAKTVLWGAVGLSVFTIDLFFATRSFAGNPNQLMNVVQFMQQPGALRVACDLLMVPISAGLFIIPLYAIMQHATEEHARARTVATNNIVNAVFMVLSGVLIMGMLAIKLTIPQVFLTLGIANLYVVYKVRDFK